MRTLVRKVLISLFFLLGSLLFFIGPVYAGVCNPLAGGQCGNPSGSCKDPRTQFWSSDACFGNGDCCYPKTSYPDTCHYNGNACQCTGESGTIPAICVDGGQSANEGPYGNFDCGGGAICVAPSYVTCEQGLSDTNAYCSRNIRCGNNYTFTYANDGADLDCSSWGNDALCCSQIQTCNQDATSGSCNANNIPANTCGYYAGTIQKTYQQYVHSGCYDTSDPSQSGYTCTPSTDCNKVTGDAGSSGCTTGFIDNCYYGNGYACTGGNVCTTNIYVHVYTDYNHDASKDGNDSGKSGVTVTDNAGNYPKTDSNGNVTFSYKTTGNYTISETVPGNFKATNASSQGVSLNDGAGNQTVNFYLTPLYNISGNIFIDKNHNQKYDGSDTGYGGGTVTVSGVGSFSVQGDGSWSTNTTLESGTYTVTYVSPLPSGYTFTTGSSYNITVGDPIGSPACNGGGNPDATCGGTNNGSEQNVDIGIDQPYEISGIVYNDINKNQKYDPGVDQPFLQSPSIQITGPTSMTVTASAADGTYTTGQVLLPGTYTVSYITALPASYSFDTSSSWTVTVGYNPPCDKGSSLDAYCGPPNNGSAGAGSIDSLNFGLTNENPWQQSVCFDVRDDSGSYTDQIPAAPACGGVSGAYDSVINGDCSTGAGIIFTCSATPDFGLGSANANNWAVGGPSATQQECYSGAGLDVVRTSYEYLTTTLQESNITPTDITAACGGDISNCTLTNSLPKGIYKASGDLHLNTFTFPVDPNNPQAFIILVNGDLYLDGNILVPAGSVAAFSVSGSIYVDKSVGNVISNPSDPAVNNPNLEGLYSADKNFIVESYGSGTNLCNADGTPLDKKLNIVGSIVANANQQGGAFTDNRDLCIYDLNCSAGSTGDGNPDSNGTNDEGLAVSYVMTLFADGNFLNHKTFNWEELKP